MGVGNQKCTDEQIRHLADQGLGVAEIARRLGVTKGAVSQRCKRLNIGMSLEVVEQRKMERGREGSLLVDQIFELNQLARASLLKGGDGYVDGEFDHRRHDAYVKNQKLILKQIELYTKLAKAWIEAENQIIFERTVLEAIGKASPEVRNAIVEQLKSQRTLERLIKSP